MTQRIVSDLCRCYQPLLLYERLIRDRFPETGENNFRQSRFAAAGRAAGQNYLCGLSSGI